MLNISPFIFSSPSFQFTILLYFLPFPKLWNLVPEEIKAADMTTFMTKLKTFLFKRIFLLVIVNVVVYSY